MCAYKLNILYCSDVLYMCVEGDKVCQRCYCNIYGLSYSDMYIKSTKAANGCQVVCVRMGRPLYEGPKAGAMKAWLIKYANENGHPMPDNTQHIQLTLYSRFDVYIRYYNQYRNNKLVVLHP